MKAGSRYGLLQPQETEGLNSRKTRQWLAFWLFPPNDNALQWLGPLSQCKNYYADILSSNLSSFESFFILFNFSVGHSTCNDKIDFPIKEDFADKRSYITPTVAWARNEFIQTDLTKLFQKARRLPGKGLNLDSIPRKKFLNLNCHFRGKIIKMILKSPVQIQGPNFCTTILLYQLYMTVDMT